MLVNQRHHVPRGHKFIGAIGGEQEEIAGLQRQCLIIDFQMLMNTQRAAEIALLGGQPEPVVLGQGFQCRVAQPVDARIPHMEQVCLGALEYQGTQGADIALVPVVAMLALPGLGMEPGVGGGQHALGGFLHRPGFRGAVVVRQKARHRRFAGDVADLAAADAIGQGNGDALGAQLRFRRNVGAVEILVARLAAALGVLPQADRQLAGQGACGTHPGLRGPG